MNYKVNILVLNYNGRDLLEQYLPSIVAAAGFSAHSCRVTLIDNVSSDSSVEYTKDHFPGVAIVRNGQNNFLCAYNDVVKTLGDDIVIFLNNDIRVAPDFVDMLLRHFTDDNVFFVAPMVCNMDGTFQGGRSYFKLDRGIIKAVIDVEHQAEYGPNHSIACGAFKRDIFLALGGFDEIYLPGIWEESDLCYRGLKAGYQGFYEPASKIYHQQSASFTKRFGKNGILRLAHRNMFIFLWKNISAVRIWASHLAYLFPRLLFAALTGRLEFIFGFCGAVLKIPRIWRQRLAQRDAPVVSDIAIMGIS
ncbi:MAG: glycosyltransferase [Candidatus Omnitrophica bacterium]|nr:glycosyltransferase [Candidatus Omnitrophota bacterium]